MFVLQSRIKIGGRLLSRIAEVEVCRSVRSLGAYARVKVPASSVFAPQDGSGALRGDPVTPAAVGAAVEIELAYGRAWQTEFRGYVRKVDGVRPLEIVCEDAYYLTRSRSVSLTGGTAKLGDVLGDCGLEVGEASDRELHNFVADEEPVSRVLERLRADFGLDVFFDTSGKVYAVEPGAYRSGEVRYEMGRNVLCRDVGGLTTFLEPYAAPCMEAVVRDPVYPDRDGRHYITGVRTVFGRGGARRTVSLSEIL
ncbi:MAG: hypothetical protein K2O01_04280 [Bacteroidales bacterium]|nr:hypothetical protein [Bacteroidales bacterium]